MPETTILASGSPYRRILMENAGIVFTVEKPQVDERAIEQVTAGSGMTPGELAQILAEAKAQDVSSRRAGALVIGSDQTLSLDGKVLHKPADMEEARRRLLQLSGRTHLLNSAVTVARDGETVWAHVETAAMTMRPLDPGFVGRHLARVGEKALTSVGGYQVEGEGIQLFERIEGDHFTIVGLPLLPLLGALRDLGAIDG